MRSTRPTRRLVRSLAAVAVMIGFVSAAPPASAATRTFTDIGVTRDGQGYAAIAETGEVYAFGTVQYRGNPVGFTGKMVGISVTADGLGYVAISSRGQVYAYGTAVYRGNPAGFGGDIVDVSVTADGLGYVAISSAGQVYAYGTAVYRGNPAGFTGTISSVSVTPDGQGYVAISTGGQVYAYNVVYRGNPSGFTGQMKSIAVTSNGQGYVAISTGGQVYAYNVVYRGNPSGFTNGIVGVGVTGDGQGYGAMSGIGQVYAYGTVVYRGNGDAGSTTPPPPPPPATTPISPGCFAIDCTGKDPKAMHCDVDATTLEEWTDGAHYELRFSNACYAAWTRVTTQVWQGPADCNSAYGQIRAYDREDREFGVFGVQAPCPGPDTAWTQMVGFGYYVRACQALNIDSYPTYCTKRY
ncbi:MAG TPA: DUF2690 domain-containing protein [Mycobacteriales bacterium]|jgi:hypothetical protein|nr:DUF2690 domain-containing protein [Mycobacteriales bacterium]